MAIRVLHRKDNLLGESAKRHEKDTNPRESLLAHRHLYAFVDKLRQKEFGNIEELRREVEAWGAFANDHGYQPSSFWLRLVVDVEQRWICTYEDGMGCPFVCAVYEEIVDA